ncbi:unnamed protein product [Brassica oleracea]|uniref:Uncharacterized protein n=1 Tax=Brassica oleracea TaxID=3712 RepID=A0A3P6GV94_BRAOL|nr:unnamed protein product [Brassica oleracea]
MQFHKAPLLYRLISELGPHCPLDVGVEIRNWIVRFVNYGSISCGRYVQGNRHEDGNVKKFTVKVPCLETLECVNEGSIVLNEEGVEDFRGYFVMYRFHDFFKKIFIIDASKNSFSSENDYKCLF